MVAFPLPRVQDFDEAQRLGRELTQAVQARREAELRCAALLAEIETRDATPWLGCASVGELGERAGLSADEARGLCDLGKALPHDPLLERKVREGRIPVAAACVVSRVLSDPKLQRGEDDWIHWAESEPVQRLRRRVRQRVEQARAGDDPVVPLTVFVRHTAREGFARAREVASGKAARALTQGETFETVVEHYLDSFDVDRIGPGKRRVGPTTHVDGRYIPMAVRREIYERQGHCCAVPLCGHTLFLDHAHIRAHACGGSREADNLILLCSFHHWLFDCGDIRLAGTAAQPVFLDSAGWDLAGRWTLGGVPGPERPQAASSQGPPDAVPEPRLAALLEAALAPHPAPHPAPAPQPGAAPNFEGGSSPSDELDALQLGKPGKERDPTQETGPPRDGPRRELLT